jgi:hypothetical protein
MTDLDQGLPADERMLEIAMTIEELSLSPGTAAVPSSDALMWPTLEALKAMGGSGTNEELLAKVIEVANVPPDQL